MRTTRKEVEAVFKNWVTAIGGRIATSYNDVGAYTLDHNSVYGGYTIHQIGNQRGGVSEILNVRLTAYYFCQALRLSMRSLEQARLNLLAEVK